MLCFSVAFCSSVSVDHLRIELERLELLEIDGEWFIHDRSIVNRGIEIVEHARLQSGKVLINEIPVAFRRSLLTGAKPVEQRRIMDRYFLNA